MELHLVVDDMTVEGMKAVYESGYVPGKVKLHSGRGCVSIPVCAAVTLNLAPGCSMDL
jgi:hypothetical protein